MANIREWFYSKIFDEDGCYREGVLVELLFYWWRVRSRLQHALYGYESDKSGHIGEGTYLWPSAVAGFFRKQTITTHFKQMPVDGCSCIGCGIERYILSQPDPFGGLPLFG